MRPAKPFAPKSGRLVIITSNNEKELPDAFLRRCFFHYIKFPDKPTMEAIVATHFPNLKKNLVEEALRLFFQMREVPGLKKKPSTSELLDWLKLLLNEDITPEQLRESDPHKIDPAAARRPAQERAGRASCSSGWPFCIAASGGDFLPVTGGGIYDAARCSSKSEIAASAASAAEPSGPPAWAMSGRPPPPLPPSFSAASRTKSTALNACVRSGVTPTTTPALPSAETADNGDDAGADALLAPRRPAIQVFHLDAGHGARKVLDPGDLPHRLAAVAAPPPIASFFARFGQFAFELACALRSAAASRSAHSSIGARQQTRQIVQDARLGVERWRARPCRSCASMRRTPAATAPAADDRHQADIAGARDMGAAAKLDRKGACAARLAHRDDADFVAIFFAEQRSRAGFDRLDRPPSAG